MRKKGENSVKRAGKADVPPDGMMFSSLGSKVNPVYPADSDSADPHLCVG